MAKKAAKKKAVKKAAKRRVVKTYDDDVVVYDCRETADELKKTLRRLGSPRRPQTEASREYIDLIKRCIQDCLRRGPRPSQS